MKSIDSLLERMTEDGFTIVPGIYSSGQVDSMVAGLERAFQAQQDALAIRTDGGSIYAARNILTLWPEAATVWRQQPLPEMLIALLGLGYGLVRGLFFDKPPERTWALPWHKDLTVAVRDNQLHSRAFTKPTQKAGVPHAEAPREVLEQMVTARIHLDDVTEENGPLKVLPGSHRTGKELRIGDTPPQSILVRRGDVLLMRPLLAHSSGHSVADTQRHRRVLHLEFVATAELPDGYAWYDFRPGHCPERQRPEAEAGAI